MEVRQPKQEALQMSNALTVSDPVLARFHGGVIRGKLNAHYARFELEHDRLAVYQHSRFLVAFGLIGLLIMRRLKGRLVNVLEFSKIATIGRGKFGFNKKILDVTMADGTTHRFNLDDTSAARIRAQIGQRARLVEAGEERWNVLAA